MILYILSSVFSKFTFPAFARENKDIVGKVHNCAPQEVVRHLNISPSTVCKILKLGKMKVKILNKKAYI